MQKRVMTAVIGLPILFTMLVLGGYFLLVTCILMAGIGLMEYASAINHHLKNKINIIFIESLGLAIIITMKHDYYAMLPFLMLLFLVLFVYEILQPNANFERGVYTLFGLIYVPLMFSFLLLFESMNNGIYFLWMVFIIAFSTDTIAYFAGIKFGRKKLAPSISPKKTVFGTIAGLLAASLGMLLYGFILTIFFHINLPLFVYPIIGFLGSIVGQCGDLLASLLKRMVQIKDFGKILPGHGGILDRFDSILLIVPFIYCIGLYSFGIV